VKVECNQACLDCRDAFYSSHFTQR